MKIIPILLILLYALIKTAQFWHWDFDDGLIVYRIARNIINGAGWCYNIGERHNPSTSVLNTALIAALGSYNGAISAAAHFVGAAALVLAGTSLFFILGSAGKFFALTAALLMLRELAQNSSWGLESNLFIALFFLFCLCELRRWNSWWVVGLLVLTRPDAILLAGLKIIYDLLINKRLSPGGPVIAAVIVAPWCLYSWMHFGQLFPDTLSNKIWQGKSGLWGSGPIYLKGLAKMLIQHFFYYAVLLGFIAAGVRELIRARSPLLLLLLFIVVQQLIYCFLNVPAYHWYFSAFNAALLFFACYGAALIYPKIRMVLAATAFLLLAGDTYKNAFLPVRDPRNESYRHSILELERQNIRPGVLAAVEVGTIGFYTERAIIDLVGLASKNPHYVTTQHNDHYFKEPARIVVLHAPPWHFERALIDDLRFRVLYENGAALPAIDPNFALQYFILNDEMVGLSREQIKGIISARYPPFGQGAPLSGKKSSAQALCVIDQVNGQLLREPQIEVPKDFLRINGWAVLTAGPPSADVTVILSRQSDPSGASYEINARRTIRPDVAAHLKDKRFNQAGFELEAAIFDLPAGEYALALEQAGELCWPEKMIKIGGD